ncbi:alpha/beta hydrolase [Roseomonas xinghualingensis]|uniref:alpha/beta hydrolase n=1 Tax=Roseomonas xinghualingensis TaxID=2986475 RepID=UPI0021F1FCA2|nr:alpha/beta hydrolase [Roseomonas sp. SXEYE001]MCV4206859.1 alpha/beta hydrolase [Roseomonas sp. SXEYE001]
MAMLSRRGTMLLPLGLAGLTAACAHSPSEAVLVPDPSGRADPEQRALLETYAQLGARPVEALTPAEARAQPSFADAVRSRALAMQNTNPQRVIGSQEDMTLNTVPTPLRARLYRPIPAHNRPLPLIVYFHGGGWVTGNIDTYDATARALCAESEALVLSVQYRQAPEFRFPAAQDDANVAWVWAVTNAASLGADPNNIAIAGESSGANLAINAALYAREMGARMPRAMVLIYPVAGTDMNAPSYVQFGNARPLGKASVAWHLQNYTRSPADLRDPRLDVYNRADLAGLPPAIIVNAEIDPLQSDGERLAEKLRVAGVLVQRVVYPGVTHEFFGADAVLGKAREAQRFVGEQVRIAFAAPPAPQPAPRRRTRQPGM